MDIKSVLVALDASEAAATAARAAAKLAGGHGAHLIGLHVVDIPVVPGYVSAELPSDVFEVQRKHYMDAAAATRERFEKACQSAGLQGEWYAADQD